jgi:hypothetical protein
MDETKYGTYKSIIKLKNSNGKPEMNLTTWKGDLVDFLVSSGIIPYPPQNGQTVEISIRENVDADTGWFMS